MRTYVDVLFRLSKVLTLAVCMPATSVAQYLDDAELVDALRAGGLNIYFRHAQTDWSQWDNVSEEGDWTSCDPERIRQLAEEGRDIARRVGDAMRKLGVPVGKVYSSPYCRSRETGELFRMGAVEVTNDVMNLRVADYFGGRTATVKRAQTRLSRFPSAGTNHVYVAHGNLSREALSVYPDEAGAVVLAPDGQRGFKVIGTLNSSDWTRLAVDYSAQ